MNDYGAEGGTFGDDDRREPDDWCTRCRRTLKAGECTDVTLLFAGGSRLEWYLCDDCAEDLEKWDEAGRPPELHPSHPDWSPF